MAPPTSERAAASRMPRCLTIVAGLGWIVVHPILGPVLLDVTPPTARTGLLWDTVPAGLARLAGERDRPAGILFAPQIIRAAGRTVHSIHFKMARFEGRPSLQRGFP